MEDEQDAPHRAGRTARSGARIMTKARSKERGSAPAEQRVKLPETDFAAARALLRQWLEEGDPEEQREGWERLKKGLDEDRLSCRPLFPSE
jgi:hypothetical protein